MTLHHRALSARHESIVLIDILAVHREQFLITGKRVRQVFAFFISDTFWRARKATRPSRNGAIRVASTLRTQWCQVFVQTGLLGLGNVCKRCAYGQKRDTDNRFSGGPAESVQHEVFLLFGLAWSRQRQHASRRNPCKRKASAKQVKARSTKKADPKARLSRYLHL